ncbi:hypothetical protein BGW38_006294 [Lunasporangiospora selenospora]|uniref:Uncharacterized protein n=1 Tax=Lunasporangiospora selenospora TaxID=979761 RepID=A0A9P6FLZ7_9FUNG|nr:hypothetical protein BGW38_006294 [Lunasporangiospora selenospora]
MTLQVYTGLSIKESDNALKNAEYSNMGAEGEDHEGDECDDSDSDSSEEEDQDEEDDDRDEDDDEDEDEEEYENEDQGYLGHWSCTGDNYATETPQHGPRMGHLFPGDKGYEDTRSRVAEENHHCDRDGHPYSDNGYMGHFNSTHNSRVEDMTSPSSVVQRGLDRLWLHDKDGVVGPVADTDVDTLVALCLLLDGASNTSIDNSSQRIQTFQQPDRHEYFGGHDDASPRPRRSCSFREIKNSSSFQPLDKDYRRDADS